MQVMQRDVEKKQHSKKKRVATLNSFIKEVSGDTCLHEAKYPHNEFKNESRWKIASYDPACNKFPTLMLVVFCICSPGL